MGCFSKSIVVGLTMTLEKLHVYENRFVYFQKCFIFFEIDTGTLHRKSFWPIAAGTLEQLLLGILER